MKAIFRSLVLVLSVIAIPGCGGGVKPGIVYGETDEFGYNVVKDPVHIHDFHATVQHLMGLNHEQMTYKHLGRRYRLTDIAGQVLPGLLA